MFTFDMYLASLKDNRMIKDYVSDFISLFYPRICFACENPLLRHEEYICAECLFGLPETNFHLMQDNPVINQFYGKINFTSAASLYYFSKGGKVQHLVHTFKYMGYKNIGLFIGKMYGEKLIRSSMFENIKDIIPIPLHPSKLRQRGYNQAEYFARGLAQSMNATVHTDVLIRTYASETQTHKTRFSRWENVKEIFALKNEDHLTGKHILLVDDVITTGSTLEAAGNVLFGIPDIKISACSLACALH